MRRKILQAGITVGTLLLCGPVLGFLATAFGMMRAFHQLDGAGISDPKALSENVGVALWSTAAGIVMFLCGAVVLTVCLVLFHRLLLVESETFAGTTVPPPLPPGFGGVKQGSGETKTGKE